MPTSTFPGTVTGVTVETATSGALSGDGSSGNKLAVGVDGTTVAVNGSDQLGAIAVTAVATGAAIKTDTTTAHTMVFQAYDVDGTAYKTFGTLTNGNTPTLTLSPPSGGNLLIILPTADPHVVGALWNDSNVVTVSAG